MTIPERGLFEHDAESSRRYKENWDDAVKLLNAQDTKIAGLEQRLAEAEADLILKNTEIKVAQDQVEPIRARCEELERKAAGVIDCWDKIYPDADARKIGITQDELEDMEFGPIRQLRKLVKTPQPAQERKGAESLLRTYNNALPSGCYCEPGRCMAPRIMGVQQACRDPQKAAQEQTTK